LDNRLSGLHRLGAHLRRLRRGEHRFGLVLQIIRDGLNDRFGGIDGFGLRAFIHLLFAEIEQWALAARPLREKADTGREQGNAENERRFHVIWKVGVPERVFPRR
jgi:hypothetical protein